MRLSPNARLTALILVNIAWAVVDKLLKKRVQNVFGTRYAFFQSQLGTAFYAASVTLLFGILRCARRARVQKPHRTCRFVSKLALVGLFDGLKHFLESIGGPNTPGSLQVLLSGLNLIFTMLFSLAVLRTSYHWVQYVGATLMVLGAPSVIIGKLLDGDPAKGAVWYSVIIYAAHSLPDAVSTVLKDKLLDRSLAVMWLIVVSTWVEFLFGWMYAPVVMIPAFGDVQDIGTAIVNGTLCFAGDTSIPVWKGHSIVGYCGELSLILTLLYAASHMLKNILQILLVKYGTASLVMSVEMLQIPLSALVFSIPVIGTEEFSWFDILGLVIVMGGFFLYIKWGKEFKAAPEEEIPVSVEENRDDDETAALIN